MDHLPYLVEFKHVFLLEILLDYNAHMNMHKSHVYSSAYAHIQYTCL